MFGRKRKVAKKRTIHTPECSAIHEAMLMSLYLGYGAPSAPLFIPTGSLVCRCDDRPDDGDAKSDGGAPRRADTAVDAPSLRHILVSA